jgi:RNA polymerase sigma-70 factor (ECF subfamily)
VTAQPLEAEDDESRVFLEAIREAKTGDSAAFEEIMIACERRVAGLAWRILGDTEEVKDAVQETFLRVFRHLDQFHEERDFIAWVYRITVNVCRDAERRRRRWRWFGSIDEKVDAPAPHQPADAALREQEDVALLTRAIDALPKQQRLAILLRDVQEIPTDEVAAMLDVKPASLRVSISKARATLRRWMEEHR